MLRNRILIKLKSPVPPGFLRFSAPGPRQDHQDITMITHIWKTAFSRTGSGGSRWKIIPGCWIPGSDHPIKKRHGLRLFGRRSHNKPNPRIGDITDHKWFFCRLYPSPGDDPRSKRGEMIFHLRVHVGSHVHIYLDDKSPRIFCNPGKPSALLFKAIVAGFRGKIA